MVRAFQSVLSRDLRIAIKRRGDWLNPLVFFVIVVTLFPLGIGPEPNRLQEIAPGVIWVAALLSTMLALGQLFQRDHADGVLEQLLLSPHPLSVIVLAKVFAHWLLTGLPLLLLSPLLGMLMRLSAPVLPVLMLSLLLGTLALSLIGAIGAALTVSIRHGGVLLALLVLPLYIPVLIFGSNSVVSAAAGLPVLAQLSLLASLCVLALALAPLAAAAALRVSASA